MRILGRKNSINVQKVMWSCKECNVYYIREDFGGSFGKLDENFAKLNPNKLVPTVIDQNNFVLWESNSICRYIGYKYGIEARVWPSDIEKAAILDQWMEWQQTTIGPHVRTIFLSLVRTKPEHRDLQELNDALIECASKWKLFDNFLSDGKKYINGEFTLGDIPLSISAHRYLELVPPYNRPKLNHLEKWYNRLKEEKPYFREIVTDLKLT